MPGYESNENDETTTIPTAPEGEQTTTLGEWHRFDPDAEADEQRRRGFHGLQTGYLVMGLLAMGAALLWLLMDQGVVEVSDGGVAWSVVLITAGAVGLIASVGKGLRRN